MIPDFQTLLLPLLQLSGDEKNHSTKEAVHQLAMDFSLTEQELNEWLPSKTQKVFYNRVHWAKAYLKMAGLIENTGSGIFRITLKGKEVLVKNLSKIDVRYLKENYPNNKELIEPLGKNDTQNNTQLINSDNISDVNKETPEEQIYNGYNQIRHSLEEELLSKLKSVHPSFFEKIVVELLIKMGYGGLIEEAGKTTSYTNDEGIDGTIREDKLGLDIIYIQAKKWNDTVVGRPEIQKFVGALAGQGAKKGIFITTSYFSKEALTYVPKNETKIVLIDGVSLAQYMIDYNLGVSIQKTFEIKKIDSDYFDED